MPAGEIGGLLSDPLLTLECETRSEPGRREAVEPFEITDEMAIVAHSDVMDDLFDRKVRRLRELFGFRHPALFQESGRSLSRLGLEKTAKMGGRKIHGASQFLERQLTLELFSYKRRDLFNAAVHMRRSVVPVVQATRRWLRVESRDVRFKKGRDS